jgi:hypothetical protein
MANEIVCGKYLDRAFSPDKYMYVVMSTYNYTYFVHDNFYDDGEAGLERRVNARFYNWINREEIVKV